MKIEKTKMMVIIVIISFILVLLCYNFFGLYKELCDFCVKFIQKYVKIDWLKDILFKPTKSN